MEGMVESKNRVVHIDATIELKDYFRAYVDAVKTRLIEIIRSHLGSKAKLLNES